MNERYLLSNLNHPYNNTIIKYNNRFLVNMKRAFQDRECIYLIMDLLQGGDLRYHFCK
jgi:serine/threonine protein kinase